MKEKGPPTVASDDNGRMNEEPDGIIAETTDGHSDESPNRRKRRRQCMIAILILVVLLGIVAVVLVLVVFKDPDRPRSYSEYATDLENALNGEKSYLGSRSSNSPHGKALTWLKSKDTGSKVGITPMNQLLERYIMALFYYSTDGPNWKDQANFLSERHICDWRSTPAEFLFCYGSSVEVTDIQFYNNSLSGTIPTEIGLMRSLWYFHLPANKVVGTIPTEFGQLHRMTSMHLSGNSLTGKIPVQLESLTSMKFVELEDNNLVGSIPTEIGLLTAVTHLYLGGNDLTGPIPAEIGNLVNITAIHFQFNDLSGRIPTSLNQLTTLQYLYLNDNSKLTGSLEDLCHNAQGLVDADADCLDGMVQCSCCDGC